MNIVRRIVLGVAGVVVVALALELVAPKAVHAVVAALVQIEPGTTTHIGQNEGQMVALLCEAFTAYCAEQSPSGAVASSAYVVPAGYTLIVTDYDWYTTESGCPSSVYCLGDFLASSVGTSYLAMEIGVLADKNGEAAAQQHFTSGIRVGSGVQLEDYFAQLGFGNATVLGYLVPN
jgi:hypothetical protein